MEGTLQEIAGKLTLRRFLRVRGLIDVGALFLVAANQAFFGHDLEGFEHRGVLCGLALGEDFVDFAHGDGAAAPENREDLEFGVSGARRHIRRHYYERLRMSTGERPAGV